MKKILVLAFLIAPLHAAAPAKPQKTSTDMPTQHAAFNQERTHRLRQKQPTPLEGILIRLKNIEAEIEALKTSPTSDKEYAENLASLQQRQTEVIAKVNAFQNCMYIMQRHTTRLQGEVDALKKALAEFSTNILAQIGHLTLVVNAAIVRGALTTQAQQQNPQAYSQQYYYCWAPQQQATLSPASTASAASSPEMAPLTLSAQQQK